MPAGQRILSHVEKLIRDRVPEIMRANGLRPVVRRASRDEFVSMLKQKLIEEAHEVTATLDPSHALEELADLCEVVEALTAELGWSEQDLLVARQAKRERNGGFRLGFILRTLGTDDDI